MEKKDKFIRVSYGGGHLATPDQLFMKAEDIIEGKLPKKGN